MHEARPDTLTAALVFIAVLAMYLLLTAVDHQVDGLFFAQSIDEAAGIGASMLQPHSLVYEPAGYIAVRFINWFASVRAITVLQYLNCLLAAGAVALVYRILRSVVGAGWLPICLALIFAMSATWWRSAIDANSIVPSVFVLLLMFDLLLPGKYERPFIVALLHTLSICLNLLSILFVPVAIAGIFAQTRGLPPGERQVQALKYAATVTVLTVGSYTTAFYLNAAEFTFGGFRNWIGSGSSEAFDFSSSLRRAITGEGKLFSRGILPSPDDLSSFTIFLLVVLVGLGCGLFYELFLQQRRRLPVRYRSAPRRPGVVGICLLWIVIYIVFLLFWTSGATEYRLFYLPAIIVLIGIWLSDRRWLPAAKRPLALCVAILAVSNLILFITPAPKSKPDSPVVEQPAPRASEQPIEEKTPENR